MTKIECDRCHKPASHDGYRFTTPEGWAVRITVRKSCDSYFSTASVDLCRRCFAKIMLSEFQEES